MPQPRHPGTRNKARRRALDLLFEADLRDADPLETLADHIARGEPPVRAFTVTLVRGVALHADELDAVLAGCLRDGWTLERMPRVDRNLARLAAWEMYHGDVAPQVAVNEAVGLAGELSTDSSPTFLNGLLGAVLAGLPTTEQHTDDQS